MLCEGPRLSVTRICADDFGSCLAALSHLRTQDSIFHLAAQVAGLHLKPAKCVLVVSGTELTQDLEEAIRAWLVANIPRFSDFKIAANGKYLGVWLGRDMVRQTYKAPLGKFADRVAELVEAHPPGPVAIFRYNEYVVSVLAYVSQLIFPDFLEELEALEHRSILKLLRMPGNSLPRALCLSLKAFVGVDPRSLVFSCLANMTRYAMSEQVYLGELAKDLADRMGDDLASLDIGKICPSGGLDSVPIVQQLFDAMAFQGPHKRVALALSRCSPSSWLLGSRRTVHLSSCSLALPVPDPKKKVQTEVLQVLGQHLQCKNYNVLYANKVRVTFGQSLAEQLVVSAKWFDELQQVFVHVKPFVRTCWLKTAAGAWCTSFRFRHMAGSTTLPCIFGCPQADDTIAHYLECPVLWYFADQFFGLDDDFEIAHRIGLINPTMTRLKRLALCHFVYSQLHAYADFQKLLERFLRDPSTGSPWHEIHNFAYGFARIGFHIVS